MIEWTTISELEAWLLAQPPIGLRLRPWFHARCEQDPAATMQRPPEYVEEDGLGMLAVWAGFIAGCPFVMRAISNPTGFGIDVCLPFQAGGDRALLDVLEQIPLPPARGPYFEQLPLRTGFAVVAIGDEAPIYTSHVQSDADAIAAFANRAGPCTVIALPPQAPSWIIVGPPAGRYVSRLEVVSSEETARRQAARWTKDTGVDFEIRRYL